MATSVTISFPDWCEYDEYKHRAEVDTHAAYPYWLALFAEHCDAPSDVVNKLDVYWLECARLCCHLEILRICDLIYGRMPRLIRYLDPADESGKRRYSHADAPQGKGAKAASKGLEARGHYRKIRRELSKRG